MARKTKVETAIKITGSELLLLGFEDVGSNFFEYDVGVFDLYYDLDARQCYLCGTALPAIKSLPELRLLIKLLDQD